MAHPDSTDAGASLREVIASDLRDAQRARDRDLMRVLRVLLAVIDNAGAVEAVAYDHSQPTLGSTEVARRQLDADELRRRLQAEADDHRLAAQQYRDRGRDDHAAGLERDLQVIQRYLDELP